MQEIEVLLEPARAFLREVGVFLPRLAIAAAVLVLGWLLAKGVRFAVAKGLRAINFNVLTERAGMDAFLRQGGARSDTTDVFALLFFWLVILAALVIAFNSLGLTYITDVLYRVVLFVPRIMVALLILVLGAYFAKFVGTMVANLCRELGADAELLGRIAQYGTLVFVVLIALEQVEIGGDIVRLTFLIVLAGVVLAFALAFGLGGREWAAALLERWWPPRKP